MKVHICLMSDQLLANYLPAKQLRPEHVLIVNTALTLGKKRESYFSVLLDTLGISSENAEHQAPVNSYDELQKYFAQLRDWVLTKGWQDITLNITGGTKLMSLAAYQCFKDVVDQIIYLDTFNNHIQDIKNNSFTSLQDLLTADDYLFVNGVNAGEYSNQSSDWVERISKRQLLTKRFARFVENKANEWFIGKLNSMASASLYNGAHNVLCLKDEAKKFDKKLFGEPQSLIQACHDFGLLEYDGNRTIKFDNVDAAQYLNGIWLEEYVFLLAKELGLADVRCSQRIEWQGERRANKAVKNEIDIVLVHNNRMLIIECKTSDLDNHNTDSQGIIYKLDSIAKDLGGLYGTLWLLSARPIDRQDILDRAHTQKIEVIHGDQISGLKEKIMKWAKLA